MHLGGLGWEGPVLGGEGDELRAVVVEGVGGGDPARRMYECAVDGDRDACCVLSGRELREQGRK